jgi:hypothetical protein
MPLALPPERSRWWSRAGQLLWPVDIILGAGGNTVLSGCWRAFALGHRLHVGDHLIFRFKLGTLEASVRIFPVVRERGTICASS